GGYREGLIAGEEPELCVRLRAAGWKIWRLDAEMTLHDAAMIRFGQWWSRATRAGFAFAEGSRLHGKPPERHWVRESRSAWFWGVGAPVAIVLLSLAWGPQALVLALVYPLQVLRLFLRGTGAPKPRAARALFLVVGKFAEAWGQLRYTWRELRGGPARLIEYK
ncbi:MAG TPA: glycosyltransferase family 2 protein, partial [Albitalea sp.]|nr:glycosyltransferase family 2 protein [Albitalea sp.]